jgi:gluconate 5-dehydrogenase
MHKYKNLFNLTGQVAVVTGGSGGLGYDMCLALAANGADIVVASRNPQNAAALVAEVEALSRRALALKVDVLQAKDLSQMVETVIDQFGRIDILINCAGTQVWQKAEEYTEENWDKVIDLNMKGTFLACREVGKAMIKAGRGKIINLSSVRSLLGFPENYTAYCASKAGVNLYSKCLAAEWAKYNINVNAIAPTFVETELTRGMLDDPKVKEGLINRIPLHRLGQPGDLVGAVLFFASQASDFITGQVLFVDGGVTSTQ